MTCSCGEPQDSLHAEAENAMRLDHDSHHGQCVAGFAADNGPSTYHTHTTPGSSSCRHSQIQCATKPSRCLRYQATTCRVETESAGPCLRHNTCAAGLAACRSVPPAAGGCSAREAAEPQIRGPASRVLLLRPPATRCPAHARSRPSISHPAEQVVHSSSWTQCEQERGCSTAAQAFGNTRSSWGHACAPIGLTV